MLQTAAIASKRFSIIVMLMIIVRFCSPKQRKSENCPLSSNPPHIKSPGLHSRPAPAWHQRRPLISMRKRSICTGAHDWKNRSWLFTRFGILSWHKAKLARICESVILCLLKRGNVCKRCFENLFFFVWEQMSGRDFGRTHSVKQSGFDSYLLEGRLKCKAFLIRISYSSGS